MPRRILVVDDVETNRLVLSKILSASYEVLEASGGAEALELLCAEYESISAVLLDIMMPEMDGYEVLAAMRRDARLERIPVIVASGATDDDAELMALSLGAIDFISKPYKPAVISQRVENVIELRETAAIINAARRDPVTGLYNRETFFKKAGELIAQHESGYYALSCMDIDNFKVINDQYGSEKGDEVLRFVAGVFDKGVSSEGGLCSRIESDDFALLYPVRLIDSGRAQQLICEACALDGSIQPITINTGRYLVEDLSLPVSAMYDRATIAQATVKGRFDSHIAQYNETMREDLLREQEIIRDMNAALDTEQFEVWFQPQYNHSTGALVGAEALVRWRRPNKELMMPSVFIPIFERSGFIYELDKYIWERVCRLLRGWTDKGLNPLPVSVNVSRNDMLHDDLIDTITGLVDKYGLGVGQLKLEITESAFTSSADKIIDTVRRLVDLGFTVEIDDFGSGYSSLNTLKDVPAQVLKLDMRFLENDENSRRGGNIIESIVRMAKWLGMSVIAEGVETIEQADYLKSIGCNYVQGFFYARPMPAEEYETLSKTADREERLLTLETVESLDNNAFWDPKSMDTLIFNSYIGAACILEFHDGDIELLRANDKYARVLGSAGMTVEDALKLNWKDYMDEASLKAVIDALNRSVETGDEVAGEYVFVGLPGCSERVYLRATMRVIARATSRYLIYCTNEDITAQREAEIKHAEADEQLEFLNDTARELLSEPDANAAITEVLKRIRGYFEADRAYVVELDREREIMKNAYEVCADGVYGKRESLASLPFDKTPFLFASFESMGYVKIDDVDALADIGSDEKKMLQGWGVRSIVAVPIMRGETAVGFICVDDPRAHDSHIGQLRAIGDYLATILARRDLLAKIESDKESIIKLMNDTPGGFARMRVMPDGKVVTEFVNDGLCRIRGMTRDEIINGERGNLMRFVHPDDVQTVKAALAAVIAGGETRGVRCRLLNGDGEYLPFLIFGRVTRSEADERFVNVYYTDLSVDAADELSFGDTLPAALAQLGIMVLLYDIKTRTLTMPEVYAARLGLPAVMTDVPRSVSQTGIVDDADSAGFESFYEAIIRGERRCSAEGRIARADGSYAWERAESVTLFNVSGEPVKAIIVIEDMSDELSAKQESERIRQSEELLRLVVEHSARVIYKFDIATKRAVSVKPAVSEAMGLPEVIDNMPDSLIEQGVIVPEDADYVRDLFNDKMAQKSAENVRLRVRNRKGEIRWLDVKFTLIKDGARPTAAVISCLDITEQHEREVAYARYRQSIDASGTGSVLYFETDLTADIVERQGGELLSEGVDAVGRTHTQIVDYLATKYVVEASREQVCKQLSREHLLTLYADGQRELVKEWQVSLPDKSVEWVRGTLQLVSDPYTGHVKAFTLVNDISREKQLDLEIQQRAETDGMTGLLNRATAESAIRSALERGAGARCVLLILDLDDLKGINDILGHAEGDVAIKSIASTLKASFRKTDIVCRAGGDEFMIFLQDVPNEARLRGTVAALIRRMSVIYVGENNARQLQCSIGGAFGTAGEDTFEELFKRADTALYHVKRSGKNNYAFYTPEMQLTGYKHMDSRVTSLRNNEMFSKNELQHLLDAISSFFPLIVSVNLTQDSFYLMEYQQFDITALPEYGTVEQALAGASHIIHPEDRREFERRLSRSALLAAYENGVRRMSFSCRRLRADGYRRIEIAAVFYCEDNGDVGVFMLIRSTEDDKERELEMLSLQKILEIAVGSSYEYICLVHPDDGTYETYRSAGKRDGAITGSGDYDAAVAEIARRAPPEERQAFIDSARLEAVVERMRHSVGRLSLRCRLDDGEREAEFFYYEPTHSELLLTVRKINKRK